MHICANCSKLCYHNYTIKGILDTKLNISILITLMKAVRFNTVVYYIIVPKDVVYKQKHVL